MRAPEFWSGRAEGRDSAIALQAALYPLGLLYAAGAKVRRALTKPSRVNAPVICIGNLTLGGAGKTPVTRALRAVLGPHAHVLSRGYGGTEKGPIQVTAQHSAADVGDEPLLHARDGATWIARDRVAGAKAAIAAGAHAILLDDGFQNPTLLKDLSFVVIDGAYGIGNGRVFPAGPLRESRADGVSRADAFIIMGDGDEDRLAFLKNVNKPVLRASLAPLAPPPKGPLIAFAGIATPQRFFDALAAQGAEIIDSIAYSDHHAYSDDEVKWLRALAVERGADLITTEKDIVRLGEAGRGIHVAPVAARFEDVAALRTILSPAIAAMGAR